jgi:hypothetical protein
MGIMTLEELSGLGQASGRWWNPFSWTGPSAGEQRAEEARQREADRLYRLNRRAHVLAQARGPRMPDPVSFPGSSFLRAAGFRLPTDDWFEQQAEVQPAPTRGVVRGTGPVATAIRPMTFTR